MAAAYDTDRRRGESTVSVLIAAVARNGAIGQRHTTVAVVADLKYQSADLAAPHRDGPTHVAVVPASVAGARDVVVVHARGADDVFAGALAQRRIGVAGAGRAAFVATLCS